MNSTNHIKNKNYLSRRGFTLIEILVSLSIFALVVVVAAGALLTAMDGNRKTQAIKSVLNNLNFALESITREVRVGGEYSVGISNESLQFVSTDGRTILYQFVEDSGADTGQIMKSVDSEPPYAVTAPEVRIESVQFYVTGEDPNDELQPKVFLTVNGYAGVKLRNRSQFNLQTTITQRLRDIDLTP
jgi:prepilin-type N-terminal cleavage/methylation domain-containing protein